MKHFRQPLVVISSYVRELTYWGDCLLPGARGCLVFLEKLLASLERTGEFRPEVQTKGSCLGSGLSELKPSPKSPSTQI